MRTDYPEDYNGPKAGQSSHEEWIAVRDITAFKYVKEGVWTYADFDCYLYSMTEEYYRLGKTHGMEDSVRAIKEFHNIYKNEKFE